MTNQKIIRKVKSLLAIARDHKNDEESQSAFLLAQKLMLQYGLEAAEVEERPFDEEGQAIGEVCVTTYKRLYWWERRLAQVIAENFRVKYFLQSKKMDGQQKRRIVFYGFGRDLELAQEMYALAYEVILFHSKGFIQHYYQKHAPLKRQRALTERVKSSYLNGFLFGFATRFSEQVSELRQVYEVRLLVPKAVEEAYASYSSDWGKSLALRMPLVDVSEAYQRGYGDGRAVDFTQRTLAEE
ncbi:DUF2786 domain-containing protein [Enterococcus sp. LJL98]